MSSEREQIVFWLENFYARHRPGDAPKIGEALLGYELVTCVRLPDGTLTPQGERKHHGR